MMHRMAAVALVLSMVVGLASCLASTDTITWGGDNSRCGYQTNHNMDPAVVGSDEFAQIFKTLLPGTYAGSPEQIFSQPLVYTPSDGVQYVYFATTQNNVYKLDAKTGEIVASRNLHIPFLSADLDGCVDINPTVGVTATGVIDPSTDTLYLTAKTYLDQTAGAVAQGRPNGRYYVHALDVNDLSERENFPVDLEGILARNNPSRMFTGGIHHQRPALLHTGQYVYAGFASHCVQYNFTGWIIGWDKTTGAIVENWSTEGDGVANNIAGGGVWMSGGGLASDDSGSMFFSTGNGYASQLSTIPVNGRNPPTSIEEAAVHMTINDDGSLDIIDFFMPFEKQALDGADKDLGTTPLEMLPSEFSCGDISRIGVVTGKSGKTYWLNLDNLGGYQEGPGQGDNVIQVYQNENSVYAGAGVYPLEGGYIYINVIQYPSHVFKFSCNDGVPSFTKVADSPTDNAYILGVSHGTVTSLDGQEGTGLVWTLDVQGVNFKIYNAIPEDGEMVVVKSFTVPGITKFSRAVFGDGRVYFGTTLGYVYGFGAPTTPALNCSSPYAFGPEDIGGAGVSKTVTCQAVIGVTVSSANLSDAGNFAIGGLPPLPLELEAGGAFSFSATFEPAEIGNMTASVVIKTDNGGAGYSSTTSVILTGTGESQDALLHIDPSTLSFDELIAGGNGSSQTVIFSNQGNAALTVSDIKYSETSPDGPYISATGSTVGLFTFSGLPSAIDANSEAVVTVAFDPSQSGNFSLYVVVESSGGEQNLTIEAAAGPAPVALLEFQTPDGSGWVEYREGTNFTFGNVTENTTRNLKFRVTNNAATGGTNLYLTVSKAPFGVAGIVAATNQVDLAEGTSLAPGESASATLYCSVPKTQWNTDPYSDTVQWTMNTNDPDFGGKQYIQFSCTAVAEQAPPLRADGEGVYRYVGCFRDNDPGRELPNQLYGDDNSTVAKCIAACAAAGYAYCGSEYQRECWAGAKVPAEQVDEGNCNYACSGDINEICGGNGVGTDAGGSFVSVWTSGNASTGGGGGGGGGDGDGGGDGGGGGGGGGSTSPVTNPGVDGFAYVGCYTEGADNTRALPNQITTANQTVEACLDACQQYTYAGLEYGGECWCGDAIQNNATLAASSDCSMTCNGNTTEYCGAGQRLDMYRKNSTVSGTVSSSATTTPPGTATGTAATTPPRTATGGSNSTATGGSNSTATGTATSTVSTAPASTPTGPSVDESIGGSWDFQGCYTEATNARALSAIAYSNGSMTLESCALFCQGYQYFGAEYGSECYCGNTINTGSVLATSQDDCSFPCAGNSTEYCGAGNRLQLYRAANWTTPTSSVPSSPASTATPAATVISSGNANFSYYGCVMEPADGRLLANEVADLPSNMTIESCLGSCWMYAYAGVEYGSECWCGDALGAGAANVSDSQCSFACPGNSTEYCGAGVRISLYYFDAAKAAGNSSGTVRNLTARAGAGLPRLF